MTSLVHFAIATAEPNLVAKLCPRKLKVFVARRWTFGGPFGLVHHYNAMQLLMTAKAELKKPSMSSCKCHLRTSIVGSSCW